MPVRIGPSLIQIALFCAWVGIVSIIWPKSVPALPLEARTLHGWALWKKCLRGMIPSLGLIFLVLGTIFMGLATPSEAGAMGVVGAIALAASYGTLTWKLLYQGMATTMRLTAMVVFILIGARVFSLVFQGVGGKEWIEHLLSALPGGQIGFLIFVNIFIFIVAFFLDFFEIAFIIIPLLAPVANKLGIDPHLVRRADLRQHPDELHASAVRVRAVLPARNRAAHRSRRRTSTGARFPGCSCSSFSSAS